MKTSAAYAPGIDSKLAVSRARIGRKECGDLNEVGRKIYHGLRVVGSPLTT